MKTVKTLLTSAALSVALTTSAIAAGVDINASNTGLALQGYDPVAYFTEGRPVEGSDDFETDHEGYTYRFSSQANLDAFIAEPEAYLPQYGGYCAYGVAKGVLSTTRPDVWVIHDGRLYLIHSAGVRRIWSSDRSAHVALADGNWPGVLRD